MPELAIIGGTGLTKLKNLKISQRKVARTPFGQPSAPFHIGEFCGQPDVVFLARHGNGHTIPPHMVNYRANIWALQSMGVSKIISVAAVGGIRQDMTPAQLAIPNQIIDYTWSRQHTFYESDLSEVVHIDFTEPYSETLRQILITASRSLALNSIEQCVYGATQGPRLETAAEIDRMERDGCDIVGMTGMPEAALAREAGLSYAHCAVIANAAAGRASGGISMKDIERNLETGMVDVRRLLEVAIAEML
ncbi:MAG: S-methyl-5'-thioinosine phosphorylase [Gammaproteobacteria bacterium]